MGYLCSGVRDVGAAASVTGVEEWAPVGEGDCPPLEPLACPVRVCLRGECYTGLFLSMHTKHSPVLFTYAGVFNLPTIPTVADVGGGVNGCVVCVGAGGSGG